MRQAMHVAGRDPKRLADAIIAIRTQLGLTQEEFAERCVLSTTTIQRVEAANVQPRTKTFTGLDRGAGWVSGSARKLYVDGTPPVSDEGAEQWTPMLTDEQITAMDSHGLAKHYIRTEREYGTEAADDWLFRAMVVRRDARRVARTLAADGS